MDENIRNIRKTPSDNTVRTALLSECSNHIIPKTRNLIRFVSKISEKLEVKYFNFILDKSNKLYTSSAEDMYSSREIICDCVASILSDQQENMTIVDYMRDVFAIQDFCGKFYEEVVKAANDEKADGVIPTELYISYLSGGLSEIVTKLVAESNRLFYTIYKFPYVLCKFKSVSNSVSHIQDIITCPNTDPENAIIILSIILLKMQKSKELSWIVCKGAKSNSVFFDEAIAEIMNGLNG